MAAKTAHKMSETIMRKSTVSNFHDSLQDFERLPGGIDRS
jgi:hypothetical protein